VLDAHRAAFIIRVMNVTKFLLAVALVVAGAGCHLLDVSGANNGNTCPASPVINAGIAFPDFKDRIPRQTALAPTDTLLDVLLIFDSAITQADRDAITTAGGTNVVSVNATTTVKAQFHPADLANYVASDTGRLSDAIVYIASCVGI
jgi:hypothetical protein